MTRACRTRQGSAPRLYARQRGSSALAALLAVVLVAVSAAAVMFGTPNVDAAAGRTTADALAGARDALIGYATSRGGTTGPARPGEFPCPDTNNDGREDLTGTGACSAGLGRLPWITIGMPEPRDSAGETLWYAVALPFRNFASNGSAINSDTLGTLTVNAAGASAPMTSQAVAVVLSPGAALGAQQRSAGAAPCGALGGAPVAAHLCASNYLEAFGASDNGAANGPFVSVPAKQAASFNDAVVYVRTADFIPAVEQRVGAELADAVEQYRKIASVYPWAAQWVTDTGALDLTGLSVPGVNRGRFPLAALPYGWNSVVAGGVTPRLPDWVAANKWHNVVYYSAGKGQLDPLVPCSTCSASTTIAYTDAGATSQVSAVLLMPGTPAPGETRPSALLSNYFEDPENNHASLACTSTVPGGCDAYVMPASLRIDRDRIFPMTSTAVTCGQAAATLASLGRTTTCGGPGNSVIPACVLARSQLLTCPKTCYAAAQTMTRPPCYNVSNNPNPPRQCVSALNQLDTCS